jgi:hypothetical protein
MATLPSLPTPLAGWLASDETAVVCYYAKVLIDCATNTGPNSVRPDPDGRERVGEALGGHRMAWALGIAANDA